MKQSKTPFIITVVAALFVIAYLALLRFPTRSTSTVQSPVAQVTRATRTPTSTATPVPPTATPVPPTATPTNTPLPPTATPLPATATPTATAVPPTNTPSPTRVPPTRVPPTATAVPVSVLTSIELPNVEGGNGIAVVNYEDWGNTNSQYYVTGSDGHKYRCEIGFLSSGVKTAQDYWSWAQRGGGRWTWIIRMRYSPNWTACGSKDAVCSEGKDNSAQMQVNSEIYIKDWAWQSLLNDYLAGGLPKMTANSYYAKIQKAAFKYVIKIDPPSNPVIGLLFTRVD